LKYLLVVIQNYSYDKSETMAFARNSRSILF